MDDEDREHQDPKFLKDGANGVAGVIAGFPTGSIIGAALGAAVGGPVGMLFGSSFGSVIGAAVGFGIDHESHEPEFREHHWAMHPENGPPFEHASPDDRHGWEDHDRP